MQTIGHLKLNGEIIKVLLRPNFAGHYVALKIRKSGSDGQYLSDESIYLQECPEKVSELKSGKVIKC